ncbi:hypothetical protein [Pseudotamlana haliotis]|nr:hypothetical protein [Tamlana haliotis]
MSLVYASVYIKGTSKKPQQLMKTGNTTLNKTPNIFEALHKVNGVH